jgi:8-hydroxy-5-deazaflavin:NADPH oxidoreductase
MPGRVRNTAQWLEGVAMKLVVVGPGDMGSALATAFARKTKHDVCIRGSRPGSPSAVRLVQELGVSQANHLDLLAADVVFVVVPWDAIAATGKLLAGYRGIVASVVVPWANGGDPRTDVASAAERLARLLPSARVVNAFTSVSSSLIRNPGSGEKPSVLACSDHEEARAVIMELAKEIGFDAVNGGKLICARYTEGLGLLCTHLAYEAGYGERVTFRVYVVD